MVTKWYSNLQISSQRVINCKTWETKCNTSIIYMWKKNPYYLMTLQTKYLEGQQGSNYMSISWPFLTTYRSSFTLWPTTVYQGLALPILVFKMADDKKKEEHTQNQSLSQLAETQICSFLAVYMVSLAAISSKKCALNPSLWQ